jgi:hypothetical protein
MGRFQAHYLTFEECLPERVRQLADEGATAIALPLQRTRSPLQSAIEIVQKEGLGCWGWIDVGRDEEIVQAHPEWMHAPPNPQWLQAFPDYTGGHPACVYPWVCVNNVETFSWALTKVRRLTQAYPSLDGYFLHDIQGAPTGCGCGDILCRSWDNSPGLKIAAASGSRPEPLFPVEFVQACREEASGAMFVPILCVEREDGAPCPRSCAPDYLAGLARALERGSRVGLLTPFKLFGRDTPRYGEPAAWVRRVVFHYLSLAPKTSLLAVVQGWDVTAQERDAQIAQAQSGGAQGVLILESAIDQSWRPVAPPPGYQPIIPPAARDGRGWTVRGGTES